MVTCSDDNTIRLWNVRHDVSEADSGEVNFVRAETLDELASPATNPTEMSLDDSDSMSPGADNPAVHDPQAFISTIRFGARIYNKYRPHQTGMYDDPLFINYEYKNFMRKRCMRNTLNISEMNFEDDLCLKCENINIERTSLNSQSNSDEFSSCQSSNSMDSCNSDSNSDRTSRFRQRHSLLGDLPVNILDENVESPTHAQEPVRAERTKSTGFSFMKRQQSSLTSLAASVFSQMSQPKTKTLKRSKARSALSGSSQEQCATRTPSQSSQRLKAETKLTSTSKKRNLTSLVSCGLKTQLEDVEAEKTPKAKKRLLALDSHREGAIGSTNTGQLPVTPSRTILDYFTAKNSS